MRLEGGYFSHRVQTTPQSAANAHTWSRTATSTNVLSIHNRKFGHPGPSDPTSAFVYVEGRRCSRCEAEAKSCGRG
eukprot:scaffold93418_cov36-Phaeocystis_antarctica.AAC.1